MFTHDIRAICVAASFVGGLLILGQLQAANTTNFTTRSGVITKFSGIDENVNVCTTSTTFVQVPAMIRSFIISAGAATPVVVTFSTSASGQGNVRLTIDGVEQTPGSVPFISPVDFFTSHAFTWTTQPLAAGVHTARIQWRSATAAL